MFSNLLRRAHKTSFNAHGANGRKTEPATMVEKGIRSLSWSLGKTLAVMLAVFLRNKERRRVADIFIYSCTYSP